MAKCIAPVLDTISNHNIYGEVHRTCVGYHLKPQHIWRSASRLCWIPSQTTTYMAKCIAPVLDTISNHNIYGEVHRACVGYHLKPQHIWRSASRLCWIPSQTTTYMAKCIAPVLDTISNHNIYGEVHRACVGYHLKPQHIWRSASRLCWIPSQTTTYMAKCIAPVLDTISNHNIYGEVHRACVGYHLKPQHIWRSASRLCWIPSQTTTYMAKCIAPVLDTISNHNIYGEVHRACVGYHLKPQHIWRSASRLCWIPSQTTTYMAKCIAPVLDTISNHNIYGEVHRACVGYHLKPQHIWRSASRLCWIPSQTTTYMAKCIAPVLDTISNHNIYGEVHRACVGYHLKPQHIWRSASRLCWIPSQTTTYMAKCIAPVLDTISNHNIYGEVHRACVGYHLKPQHIWRSASRLCWIPSQTTTYMAKCIAPVLDTISNHNIYGEVHRACVGYHLKPQHIWRSASRLCWIPSQTTTYMAKCIAPVLDTISNHNIYGEVHRACVGYHLKPQHIWRSASRLCWIPSQTTTYMAKCIAPVLDTISNHNIYGEVHRACVGYHLKPQHIWRSASRLCWIPSQTTTYMAKCIAPVLDTISNHNIYGEVHRACVGYHLKPQHIWRSASRLCWIPSQTTTYMAKCIAPVLDTISNHNIYGEVHRACVGYHLKPQHIWRSASRLCWIPSQTTTYMAKCIAPVLDTISNHNIYGEVHRACVGYHLKPQHIWRSASRLCWIPSQTTTYMAKCIAPVLDTISNHNIYGEVHRACVGYHLKPQHIWRSASRLCWIPSQTTTYMAKCIAPVLDTISNHNIYGEVHRACVGYHLKPQHIWRSASRLCWIPSQTTTYMAKCIAPVLDTISNHNIYGEVHRACVGYHLKPQHIWRSASRLCWIPSQTTTYMAKCIAPVLDTISNHNIYGEVHRACVGYHLKPQHIWRSASRLCWIPSQTTTYMAKCIAPVLDTISNHNIYGEVHRACVGYHLKPQHIWRSASRLCWIPSQTTTYMAKCIAPVLDTISNHNIYGEVHRACVGYHLKPQHIWRSASRLCWIPSQTTTYMAKCIAPVLDTISNHNIYGEVHRACVGYHLKPQHIWRSASRLCWIPSQTTTYMAKCIAPVLDTISNHNIYGEVHRACVGYHLKPQHIWRSASRLCWIPSQTTTYMAKCIAPVLDTISNHNIYGEVHRACVGYHLKPQHIWRSASRLCWIPSQTTTYMAKCIAPVLDTISNHNIYGEVHRACVGYHLKPQHIWRSASRLCWIPSQTTTYMAKCIAPVLDTISNHNIYGEVHRACVGYHYTQTNTNNVNKTRALLQTTGGKDEPNIVFMRKS